MTTPAPLQSFLGGLTLPLPVHFLMLLNGSVFGISGFIHRAASGKSAEALTAVAGLIFGGVLIGLMEGSGPPLITDISPPVLAVAGLLVGLGSKLANGCTSGHMICGLSRFSHRSIIATVLFFITGIITSRAVHYALGPNTPSDWSLGLSAKRLLLAQIAPFIVSALLYVLVPLKDTREANVQESKKPVKQEDQVMATSSKFRSFLRHLALISTTLQFAFALQLSGLASPSRVVRFLLLPMSDAFDPSLVFLALGALPFAMLLYHYARGNEIPRLGGLWTIPKGGEITAKLVIGSAIFGVGWGLAGICPGPGLINFGRALIHSEGQFAPMALWLVAVCAGGLLV